MTYNSSKTGAQVDGAVTDVQAAKAASPTDTTAGRLLKIGDFGVGGDGIRLNGVDLNALVNPGLYYVNDPSTNKPTVEGGTVLVAKDIASTTSQLYTDRTNGIVYSRIRNASGIWQPWRELYHTGNTIVDVNGFIKEA